MMFACCEGVVGFPEFVLGVFQIVLFILFMGFDTCVVFSEWCALCSSYWCNIYFICSCGLLYYYLCMYDAVCWIIHIYCTGVLHC